MYKLMGGSIIMLCFITFGVYKSFCIRRRLKCLREFRLMIEALRTEISFCAIPLSRAAREIGERFSNECFIKFAELIPEVGGQRAFEKAVGKFSDKYFFSATDKSCILLMANGIGRTDVGNQIRQLDYTISELDKIIMEASGECSQKTRGYINGSVLVGAFFVLMLM